MMMNEEKRSKNRDILRLEDHEGKVQLLQNLKDLGPVFQKSQLSYENSPLDIRHTRILKDYAKSFLYRKKECELLLNSCEDNLNVSLQDEEGSNPDEYKISDARYQFLEYLNFLKTDDQNAVRYEAKLYKGEEKTFFDSLSLKDYQTLMHYSHTKALSRLIEKDLRNYVQGSDNNFFEQFANYSNFAQKKSLISKKINSWIFQAKLWFYSLFSKNIPHPFKLKSLFAQIQEHNENEFLRSLAHLVQQDPQILNSLLQIPSFMKIIKSIENYDDKFFSVCNLGNDQFIDFHQLWKIHEIFAEYKMKMTSQAHFDLLVQSLNMHCKKSENKRYYAQILKSAPTYNLTALQFEVLTKVFSEKEKNIESWYENFIQYEFAPSFQGTLDDIAFWLADEKKVLDKKLWNFFILKNPHYSANEIFDILQHHDLFSHMNFEFDQGDLLWVKKLSLERQKHLCLVHRESFTLETLAEIQIPLYAKGILNQREFMPLTLKVLDYQHAGIAQQAFDSYEQLKEAEIDGQENFAFTVKKFLACLPRSEMSKEQKLLLSIPFVAKDITGDKIMSFLTWYHANDTTHQLKAKSLLVSNLQDLFLQGPKIENFQTKLLENMLVQLNSGDLSFELNKMIYARRICDKIRTASSQREILEVMLSCDFHYLSSFSKDLRVKFAHSLAHQKTLDNANLLSTLEYWIEYLEEPNLKKLFLSPKQFAQDLISNHHQIAKTLNPVDIEYLNFHLSKVDKEQIIHSTSENQKKSRQVLAFVNSLDKSLLKRADFSHEAEYATVDLRQSALEGDLENFEEKAFDSLCNLQSYLLTKISSYLPHPFLIEDLYQQANSALKADFYDDLLLENLTLQIKQYPFEKPMKYKNYAKVAQNIILVAWVDKLRDLISEHDRQNYLQFAKKINSLGCIESKTARGYIKKLNHFLQQQENKNSQLNLSHSKSS